MPVFGGSEDRGQRTAAEREQARRERERRRAQRAGREQDAPPSPEEPVQAGADQGGDAQTAAHELPVGVAVDEPQRSAQTGRPAQDLAERAQEAAGDLEGTAATEQEGAADQQEGAADRQEDAADRQEDAADRQEDAADPLPGQRAGEGAPEEADLEAAGESDPGAAASRPSPARRVGAGGAAARSGEPAAAPGLRGEGRGAQAGRSGPRGARPARGRPGGGPPRHGPRGGERRAGAAGGRRTLAARIGAVAALIFVGAAVWLLVSIFQPFQGSGHGRVVVEIPKGAGASKIGSILASDGVVSSGFFFDVRAFLAGKRGDFHPGRYVLKLGMSYSSAIAALTGEVPHVAVVKVVIPEGETRPQIAAIAREDGLKGDYLRATKHAKGFDPVHYGAPASTPNLEGFLFPATYEVDVHGNVNSLVSKQLEAFNERFDSQFVQRARQMHITPYQLLIVASMIEREAKLPKDRPLIAAVIYNRLRLGMPLGIDATIRFALHDYSKPLTEAQLHVESPYNTRLHKGLPPTPISNPGVESIEAAASPAKVGYLYYVNGTDGCGDLVFSNSFAEFERDSAAYQEALSANGGNEPKCKKG